MIDPSLASIVTAVITIPASVVGTKVVDRGVRQAEKRKKIREGLEEVYTLATQVRIWVHVTLRDLYKIGDIDYYRDVIPAKYLEETSKEPDCPLDRLRMRITLDVPSLVSRLGEYVFIVSQLRNMRHIYDTQKSKSSLDYYVTGVVHNEVQKICGREMISAAEFWAYVSKRFDELHAELLCSLGKIAQKN